MDSIDEEESTASDSLRETDVIAPLQDSPAYDDRWVRSAEAFGPWDLPLISRPTSVHSASPSFIRMDGESDVVSRVSDVPVTATDSEWDVVCQIERSRALDRVAQFDISTIASERSWQLDSL